MTTGIHIGHNQESMAEIKTAILEILNCRSDQQTIREALSILKDSMRIEGVSLNNISVNLGGALESSTPGAMNTAAEPAPPFNDEEEES